MFIPSLLQQLPGETTDFICHESPHIQRLIAQVFFRLVDQSHDAWGTWADLLIGIDPILKCASHPSKDPREIRIVYSDDEQLALILIRHLHQQALHIPKMVPRDLERLASYIRVFMTPRNFQYANPMFSVDPKGSMIALSNVLCRILRKKSLRAATTDKEEIKRAWDVAHLAFETIYVLIEDRVLVESAPWSKVFKAIFNSAEPFLRPGSGSSGPKEFTEWSTLIIDRLARFLVYKTVARQFHRVLRKGIVTTEALERVAVLPHGKELAASWANAVEKTEISRAQHQAMKGKVLCSYPEDAPKFGTFAVLDALQMPCTAPANVESWTGRSITVLDVWSQETILTEWLKSFVRDHIDILIKRLDEFMAFIQREAEMHPQDIPEDRKPILEGRKQPALYIDFNPAVLPRPEDPIRVQFVDHSLLNTQVSPYCPEVEGVAAALKHWNDPAVDETKLFVLGLFPRDRIRSLRMFDVMEFPPGAGNSECEGFYKSVLHDGVKDCDMQALLGALRVEFGEEAT
ncbi:hypothetical protein AAF712_013480 [Marasmius tenuissimus]|uniref:Uncharacterized protein n=1 Tax=Marasmius tenuissimus TaxID=585030 RepID=A0ABR2ZEI7_9AGAR